MSALQVGYFCTKCSEYNVYPIPGDGRELDSSAGRCASCQHLDPPSLTEDVRRGGLIDRCPQCANLEFYTRKDFPQQLGCAAVVVTILMSSIAYAFWHFPAALAVLVLASIADLFLYHRLPEVSVCYRCHTELRGFDENPAHGPFDMHRAEEYEHETSA
jgi:hypothetical protein